MYDEKEVCPLLIAFEKGLTEAARILLEVGANPNNGNKEDQCRPITAAVSRGYIEIVQLLIDHGLNVNNPARRGTTGLHTAVIVGNLEAVKLLMKAGADPTEQDVPGSNSALINACYCKELNAEAIVRYLLENYPDKKRLLDLPGYIGTAVHVCTRLSGFEKLQVLFEFGANANALSLDDELPLNLAISNRDKRFVEILLPHTSLTVLNACPIDPVAQTVALADLELFQLLMERGVESDRITDLTVDLWEQEEDEVASLEDCLLWPKLGTPLAIAVMRGAHDIALELVARGSRLHFAYGAVLSPLLVTLYRRKESDRYDLLLQRMLERGQETLSLNETGGTPFPSIPTCLVILVSHGYSTAVLRWLLKKGMNARLENWAIVPVWPDVDLELGSFEETVSRRLSQTQRDECLSLMAQFTKSTSPSYAWLLRNISPEVADRLTTPRSLQQLCRFTIRESVEKPEVLQTSAWASDLGLPDKLQKYVLYEDGD